LWFRKPSSNKDGQGWKILTWITNNKLEKKKAECSSFKWYVCMVSDVCFFISQPIQDKEIFAEDEQTFLARQQVGLPFKITVRQRGSVITSESVY